MKLLVAIDLHDSPEELLDEAVVWAGRTRGTLSVMFVEELGESWSVGVADPTVLRLIETERATIRASHRKRLEELLERVPAELRGEVLVGSGTAWHALAEASERVDLLLIGTHGRKGLAHFFLGSVAERVVRAAKCSVLVLRPSPQEA